MIRYSVVNHINATIGPDSFIFISINKNNDHPKKYGNMITADVTDKYFTSESFVNGHML